MEKNSRSVKLPRNKKYFIFKKLKIYIKVWNFLFKSILW